MNIPLIAVVLLGIGAVLKDIYRVYFKHSLRSIGSLVAVAYMLVVYILLSFTNMLAHGGLFVRVGIALIFIDKLLVFLNDLIVESKLDEKVLKYLRGEDNAANRN